MGGDVVDFVSYTVLIYKCIESSSTPSLKSTIVTEAYIVAVKCAHAIAEEMGKFRKKVELLFIRKGCEYRT